MKRDYTLFKELLSVPTVTYREDHMIEFLTIWLSKNGYNYYLDEFHNIYVTKETTPVEFFPCVVAHTDTVHGLDTIIVREEILPNEQNEMKDSLKSYNLFGKPTGIGGDDKCGIYACLRLLEETPNIKVAFFVSEETGCHGSKHADPNFFNNVGYCIQFDAPGNSMVSEFCMGVRMFDRNSEFFKVCDESLSEGFMNRQKYQSHPYTDVFALKRKFDFSCINFAIGYYDYHTPNEYIVLEDVESGILVGKLMIERLGNRKYEFKSKSKIYEM